MLAANDQLDQRRPLGREGKVKPPKITNRAPHVLYYACGFRSCKGFAEPPMVDATKSEPPESVTLFGRWHATPLYLRILAACLIGAAVGVGLRQLDLAIAPAKDAIWLAKPLG